MATLNNMPKPDRPANGSAALPYIIVKDNVLLQPNGWNGIGLDMNNPDTAVQLESTSTTANCGWLRVPVDVTNYSTLTVVCSGQSAYKANQYPVVSVDPWTVYNSGSTFNNLGTIGYLATSSTAVTNRTVTVDISSLTGVMLLSFAIGIKPAAFYIHQIYLS